MKTAALISVVWLFSLGSVLWAQVDRATVTGTVHDPTGAVVGDAQVTITYSATGLTRSVTSNDAGVYFITGLPVGSVAIRVEKPGLRPVLADTELQVAETRTLDFDLDLAGVETEVDVVTDADLVRNSATVGSTFENTQISQLPVNGRDWENLMILAPGAIDTGAGNGSSVRFFGRGGDDNNFRIDGVDATAIRNQSEGKSRLLISSDAIAEFRVNSALYTAESGGAPGGQIEIASKTGANQLHGGVFEYLRNSALDSRSPFDGKTLPPFRLNQFGGTIGGPLIKDRTFFFASYEGLVQHQGRTLIGFVPSATFRASVVPALKPLLAARGRNLDFEIADYQRGTAPTSIRARR